MSRTNGDDEFDNVADDFSGINFDAIKYLAPVPASNSTPQRNVTILSPQEPFSANSSSPYSIDESFDDAFLRELDVIEGLAQKTAPCSKFKPAHKISDPHVQIADPSVLRTPSPRKSRKRQSSSPLVASNKKKGKIRSEGFRQALEGIEDEMSCPICCELFVAAHLSNPCGHTLCGECAWQWVTKNKKNPTCALCRTALNRNAPIIPNIAVDNTVEKHIEILASNGGREWQSGGKSFVERTARKENWKKIAAERVAQSQKKKSTRRGRNWAVMDDEEFLNELQADEDQDETYYDSDVDLRFASSPRTTRSRRFWMLA